MRKAPGKVKVWRRIQSNINSYACFSVANYPFICFQKLTKSIPQLTQRSSVFRFSWSLPNFLIDYAQTSVAWHFAKNWFLRLHIQKVIKTSLIKVITEDSRKIESSFKTFKYHAKVSDSFVSKDKFDLPLPSLKTFPLYVLI